MNLNGVAYNIDRQHAMQQLMLQLTDTLKTLASLAKYGERGKKLRSTCLQLPAVASVGLLSKRLSRLPMFPIGGSLPTRPHDYASSVTEPTTSGS